MLRLRKKQSGFTIVELLIVIVVIGILALIVITTYSGIQAKARNAKRQTDISAIQTQLEAFFSQNGYYPNLGDLNNASWRTTNMPSLDQNALVDPSESATSCGIASNTGTCVASAAAAKTYAYQPTDSSGNASNCSTTDTTCAQYTLTASFEGTVNGQSTDVKNNLD